MTDGGSLLNISPVDGRYRSKTDALSPYFSEFALFRYRLMIEIEYFIALCELPLEQLRGFNATQFEALRRLYSDFKIEDAERIKQIESSTNHDVKAVEYYLAECFKEMGLQEYTPFLHFGLTSQDLNNTAIPLSLKAAMEDVVLPLVKQVVEQLNGLAAAWADVPMLAHTHGQPASPTRVGKELKVFSERLQIQLDDLRSIPFTAKFGGATGNFNAHHAAYPDVDWIGFADEFVEKLGLKRQQTTTQIEHYDRMAASFHALCRINTVMMDLCRDIWLYISLNYFSQKITEGEVGSSTMPHKVNPIDFENAEGNLAIANAALLQLASKLPISRLQRDLTDSTTMRNIGVPLAHGIIACKSLLKGLGKLVLNRDKLNEDLGDNWAVVAEAVQTILRREGFTNAYELLKELTRKAGQITGEQISSFVDDLDMDESVKNEIKSITPFNYTGL
ncbi:MAG: adenylosuccinate lyase [Flavobacteriales bacterium]